MANKIPLKATYSGSNTSGLAELQSGDTIAVSYIDGLQTSLDAKQLAAGDYDVGDNVKIKLGGSDDLQIYANAGTSYIKESGSGHLEIRANNLYLKNADGTTNYLVAISGDETKLYFDNSSKLATTSSGIDVTGSVAVSGTVDGVDIAARDAVLTSTTTTANNALPKAGGTMTGEVEFQNHFAINDNKEIRVGSGNDLKIYHDSVDSYVEDVGTGHLFLRSNGNGVYIRTTSGGAMAQFINGGECQLFHNTSEKLATTSGGITVTGTVGCSSDGSGASPTYTFASDTDTGMFRPSANALGFATGSLERWRMVNSGDFHADGDVIAYSTTVSDERLKENIQPIEDALSKVNQLNGCTFTYTADGKESAGLIAQEVEKVLPSAVSEKELPLKTDDGKAYKVLQYDQTIGLLVEAIKELTAKVEALEGK